MKPICGSHPHCMQITGEPVGPANGVPAFDPFFSVLMSSPFLFRASRPVFCRRCRFRAVVEAVERIEDAVFAEQSGV